MENLPNDILENILLRLPGEAALQAKQVCLTWRAVLRNYKPHKPGYLFVFTTSSGKRQLFYGDEYEHYDPVKMNYYNASDTLAIMERHRFPTDVMVGSCNGLVCFGKRNSKDGHVEFLKICNPLTGEYVSLPNFSSPKFSSNIGSVGFGYCHPTKEYKVVRICKQGRDNGHVQVYTVGGKHWRSVKPIHCCEEFTCSSGIYANGALHWLRINRTTNYSEIVAFDLELEKSCSILLPEYVSGCSFKLLGQGNNFYFVYFRTRCIDIWALKRNNTSSDLEESNQKQNYEDIRSWSWIKEFSIECLGPDKYTPFAITRNNEVLLWYRHQLLYCYDPKTSTLNQLWRNNIMLCCLQVEAIPHMHSIVSLKDLGETHVWRNNNTTNWEVTTLQPKVEKVLI